MKRRILTFPLLCLALTTAAAAQDKSAAEHTPLTAYATDFDSLITPTPEWINLYCDGPELDGIPLMTGDTILAYDPDGVLCGMDTVRVDGKYGFMPVYRDDEFTDSDEGALPGDTISFTVNNRPVRSSIPVVWTENGASFEVCAFASPDEVLNVGVDIKPGSCPNPFNTRGNLEAGQSVLPVAVLGSDLFDVSDIDPSSITLAGVAPIRHSYEDVAMPFDGDSCDCHARKGDGYEDLTLKFLRYDILQAIAPVSDGEYVPLILEGATFDGTKLSGFDCIWIKGDYAGNDSDGDTGGPLITGNYPNPFNPTTTIQFEMPTSGSYALEVFDLRGRQVASYAGTEGAGPVAVEFDASRLASGVYFYRITVDQWQETRKMLLLK